MQDGNHIITGIAVGAAVTFAYSLYGQVDETLLFGSVLLGAVLPNLDEPRCFIGKLFIMISIIINRLFSHRGFFHSPLCWILICFFLWKKAPYELALGITVGAPIHLLEDYLTRGGIPLLYPFKKKRYACIHKKIGEGKERFMACCLSILVAILINVKYPFMVELLKVFS